MVFHVGERVFWGAPAVIYLERPIVVLHPEDQRVIVHYEDMDKILTCRW
jgi:hypothetical protein